MGVYVRFGRRKAFLRRGVWVSSDSELEQRLNRLTKSWIQKSGGPPIGDPDHDYTAAREIAEQLGGRIAKRVRPSSSRAAGVYMSLRQLKLDLR